jgi:hypothetical protein
MRPQGGVTLRRRLRAVRRALSLLHTLAREESTFVEYGGHVLFAFSLVGTTARNRGLRRLALALGRERAEAWRRSWPARRRRLDADTVMNEVIASYAAGRLGLGDARIRRQLGDVLARYSARELLYFDASREDPPANVPEACAPGHDNERGSARCRTCGRALAALSRYEVWHYALTSAFFCERHGTPIGVAYTDVLDRRSSLRPYPRPGRPGHYECLYAVTHTVYTLNDYGTTRVSTKGLEDEYAFLLEALPWALRSGEVDAVAEIVDSLAALGAGDAHPLIVRGREFLLARQQPDGGWGEAGDAYRRFHHVWAAIDGLRDYAWRPASVRSRPGL